MLASRLREFRYDEAALSSPSGVSIDDVYGTLCMTPPEVSNIHGHFPTLRSYAEKCESVIEFGVWYAQGSTWALLAGKPKWMVSVDINYPHGIELVRRAAKNESIDYHFVLGDSKTARLPQCDLLFIDSEHTYAQVRGELAAHAGNVRKYLIFHDTVTCWDMDTNTGGEGIGRAIDGFVEASGGSWRYERHDRNQNGLMVLARG